MNEKPKQIHAVTELNVKISNYRPKYDEAECEFEQDDPADFYYVLQELAWIMIQKIPFMRGIYLTSEHMQTFATDTPNCIMPFTYDKDRYGKIKMYIKRNGLINITIETWEIPSFLQVAIDKMTMSSLMDNVVICVSELFRMEKYNQMYTFVSFDRKDNDTETS
jgi:hypothetical protein